MSNGLVTLLLLLGHYLFRGYFTPVLIFAFAWELNQYRSEKKHRAAVLEPSEFKRANFIMNRVPFILPVFAVLAFALISVSSERDWLKWLASPIFDFERKWLAPSAVVSVAKANSLTAGYIGYLTAISLSILFRRQVAVGIVDGIKTKVPVVTPGREFTNKSAWIFCLAGFLMADCLVGFFAFQLLPSTPDKRWFLPFCFLFCPRDLPA